MATRTATLFTAMLLSAGAAHAQTPGLPRPLPSTANVVVQLPGANRARFATVAIDISSATAWTLEGCVSAGAGSCRATARVVLTQAQREQYARLWTDAYATHRCEPETVFPGDGTFRFGAVVLTVDVTGFMPADPAQLAARNAGPCRAYARLALWVGETFAAGGR